mmetsp:Transcript_37221/g.88884  ORF Transcript_37221/g.88884 Transcript_37221/m.88884 type:complete len:231 (+) Transcript_37221:116-808(+)
MPHIWSVIAIDQLAILLVQAQVVTNFAFDGATTLHVGVVAPLPTAFLEVPTDPSLLRCGEFLLQDPKSCLVSLCLGHRQLLSDAGVLRLVVEHHRAHQVATMSRSADLASHRARLLLLVRPGLFLLQQEVVPGVCRSPAFLALPVRRGGAKCLLVLQGSLHLALFLGFLRRFPEVAVRRGANIRDACIVGCFLGCLGLFILFEFLLLFLRLFLFEDRTILLCFLERLASA